MPTQYTIRGVPNDLDSRLRRLAKLKGQSLNRIVLDQLGSSTSDKATGATNKIKANRVNTDFDDLFGTLTPLEPEVIESLKAQRVVWPEDWR